jgi:transcriptional regulator GlxA family with amidase domain
MLCDDSAMQRVAVLALPGVLPLELSVPSRLMAAARLDGRPLYDVRTCGLGDGSVTTAAGFDLAGLHGPEVLATADTVIVPPSLTADALRPHESLPTELEAALNLIHADARMVGLCTGVFVLAAGDLLHGRRATTHWQAADELAQFDPTIRVCRDVLFTVDGKIATSAGGSAAIDLCLHLIRHDHGSAVAADVARACIVPPWREGGQAQYVRRPVPAEPAGSTTATIRQWMLDHLDEPLTLSRLARQASMSERTLTRTFRDETGHTIGQWLTLQRIELAKEQLESTQASIDKIAATCGFGSAAALRKHFAAHVGLPPSRYRAMFHV